MSEKQNYDKILLASGIVLGLGVAVYGTVTLLGLNDKYKFTTQVSEKAIEPPPGIKKAAEVNQELCAGNAAVRGLRSSQSLDQGRGNGTL